MQMSKPQDTGKNPVIPLSQEEMLSLGYIHAVSEGQMKEEAMKLLAKKQRIMEYMNSNKQILMEKYGNRKFMKKVLYVLMNLPNTIDTLELDDSILQAKFVIDFDKMFVDDDVIFWGQMVNIIIPVNSDDGKDLGIIKIEYTRELDEYLNKIL
jgi:hypothetical protein